MRMTIDYESGFYSLMLGKGEGKIFPWKPEYSDDVRDSDFIVCDGKMNPLYLISENTPKSYPYTEEA